MSSFAKFLSLGRIINAVRLLEEQIRGIWAEPVWSPLERNFSKFHCTTHMSVNAPVYSPPGLEPGTSDGARVCVKLVLSVWLVAIDVVCNLDWLLFEEKSWCAQKFGALRNNHHYLYLIASLPRAPAAITHRALLCDEKYKRDEELHEHIMRPECNYTLLPIWIQNLALK